MKRPPLVLVTWADSALTAGWHNFEPKEAYTTTCTTVGYLLRKTRSEVSIAQSNSSNGRVDAVMGIPRACIRSIRCLR